MEVDLFVERGLVLDDRADCIELLSRVGYYHLSGYARFFQVDPARGDNTFQAGTTLTQIRDLQELDELLRHMCLRYLGRVETALRTTFALRFGELVGAYGALMSPDTYHSTGARGVPVEELVMADLVRCKAKFVTRHQDQSDPSRSYTDLPVWAAVEALSFGTLSKCIEHTVNAEVAKTIASDFSVNHTGFSSQVRSFVSLRNECAHHSRLWNDVSKNPASVPNNLLGRAKRRMGQFDNQSRYHLFVALDRFSPGRIPGAPSLLDSVEALMDTNPDFSAGLLKPKPY